MAPLEGTPAIFNASRPLPWLVTAGQPSADQLAEAAKAGINVVIDLRDAMEPRGFDESAAAAKLGVAYHNVPVMHGALSDEAMDRILTVLRSAAGNGTLMHCASANRTGGPLLAYLLLDEHLGEQDAVSAAMRSGLRGVDIMEWGIDYARRHQEKTSA